ncbi:FAD NAD(P)-binding domain-containing [Chlorella sorokiniana]|uniref:FAD NAD(P)-binding domain-containing n=1 Tax=Chlorella sorokiniana TaxID=3076 RepID=A0A2P6TDN4_CHLSO|nr:FAD NAD(P)-binding domain-containing [Chlorella sorokiniana]|eukprot:PRW20755.1 FAD NAD(P)-binding domain-containing [Chlorella sorokiniana]
MTAQCSLTVRLPDRADEVVETEMTIVGGGICGILAAKMCGDRQWPYVLVERSEELGGAYEPNYRWDKKYRLNQDELTKGSGAATQQTLKRFAYDHCVDKFTRFSTEVLTVRHRPDGLFLTICKNLKTGKITHIVSQFMMISPGILTTQVSAAERGVKDVDKFKNTMCYAGKHNGVDSAVGNTDLTGKNVVIMGTGSFALEALEAAGRNNAKHITLVSRPRKRWICPFSRQYTVTAMCFAPFLPWNLKIKFVHWYLRRKYYNPVGLKHMPPTGELYEQDWSGQCNDGLFRLAAEGRLDVLVGQVDRLEAKDVVVKTSDNSEGVKVPADMFVVASGCHYNLNPPFLHELGIGFGDIHNYCFMGRNPRIGTASDFVFAFVPAGPISQLEMYFHAVEQIKLGREREVFNAMYPTPLGATGKTNHTGGRMAGLHTFFASRNWLSRTNIASELRTAAYISVMEIGQSLPMRMALRVGAYVAEWHRFFVCVRRSARELWNFPIWGKGVKDHYHPTAPLLVGSTRKNE